MLILKMFYVKLPSVQKVYFVFIKGLTVVLHFRPNATTGK